MCDAPPRPSRANSGAQTADDMDDLAAPAVIADATAPALDYKIGLRFSGGNPDLYARLLGRFHETQRDLMARLDAADADEAHRIGHTLKSSAGLIGAVSLSAAARDFEAACEQRDGRAIDAARVILRQRFACVMAEIEAQIKGAPKASE